MKVTRVKKGRKKRAEDRACRNDTFKSRPWEVKWKGNITGRNSGRPQYCRKYERQSFEIFYVLRKSLG